MRYKLLTFFSVFSLLISGCTKCANVEANRKSVPLAPTAATDTRMIQPVVVEPAPWCAEKAEPQPLPKGWEKHRADNDLSVPYAGGKVQIKKGDNYFTYKGKIAVGWHGSYNPPCGME